MKNLLAVMLLPLVTSLIIGAATEPTTEPTKETAMTPATSPSSAAWSVERPYRLLIEVDPAGVERVERPVDIPMTFEKDLILDSLQVVEVDATGAVVNANVSFQFDKETVDSASAPASEEAVKGNLVLLLQYKKADATAPKRFYVYYDKGDATYEPASIPALVSVEDGVMDEGQESFKIKTPHGDWYYHKEGAGFSSLVDKDGNDWLSYSTETGAKGEYRGLPNTGHKEGYMHPGKEMSTSRIVSQGPLKVTIESESEDGKWAGRWELFPRFSVFTITKVSHPYWFLYEGTPGGTIEADQDYWVRADGSTGKLNEPFEGKAMDEDWAYFADHQLKRALFLVNHRNMSEGTTYRLMENAMTVFGFGRIGMKMLMEQVPAKFTVGLAESKDEARVKTIIQSSYKDFNVTVGEVESQ